MMRVSVKWVAGALAVGAIIVACEPWRLVAREARIDAARAEIAQARAKVATLEARWARAHAPTRLRALALTHLDARPPHTEETINARTLPWRAQSLGAPARAVFPLRGAYTADAP